MNRPAVELLYDRDALCANVERMRERLPFAELHYAAKACAEPPVLGALAATGIGFEAAGTEEFELLVGLGVPPGRILCGLPVKGPLLIRRLYRLGCRYFVFDCVEEFAALRREAPDALKILRLAVTDLDPDSALWGATEEELDAAAEAIPGFWSAIDGLTFHLARNYRTRLLRRVFDRVEAVLERLGPGRGLVLNLGGGFRTALPRHLAMKYDLEDFYSELCARVAGIRSRFGCRIMAEPGRGIVDNAGRLQAPVMQVRSRGAGEAEAALELNIGVRPGAHPTAIHALGRDKPELLYDIDLDLAQRRTAHVMCNFVDATCEYSVMYRLPLLRVPRPTELLSFSGLGAYTTCLSSSFHQRRAPVVRLA